MADFSSLKQTIQSYIKQNGNEEITGNILQDVLLAMVTTMGDSAINGLASALQDEITARQNQDGTLQGNITAETTARQQADTALGGRIDGLQTAINGINTKLAEGYIYAGIATPSTNPVTPSGKVFYIAVQAGIYTNLGGTEVTEGITILKYNGTSWVKEQALFTDGGVFDISAYNLTNGQPTPYADLAAALGANGANVPDSLRKGGMSVKFIHGTAQSLENKYVQYRLIAQLFSNNPNDWELDVTSKNLIYNPQDYTNTQKETARTNIGLTNIIPKVSTGEESLKVTTNKDKTIVNIHKTSQTQNEITITDDNDNKLLYIDKNGLHAKEIFYGQNETNLQDKIEYIEEQIGSGGSTRNVVLIMFMGQSNMAGRGVTNTAHPQDAPAVIEGAGYEFRAYSDPTKLYPITKIFGNTEDNPQGIDDSGRKTGGPVPSFVNAFYRVAKTPVIGVSASEGGESIVNFQPNTSRYNDAVSRFHAAENYLTANGYNILARYVVWCQGEKDGDTGMSEADYISYFNTMASALFAEGIEDMMVIRIGEYNGSGEISYSNIINAQTSLCKNNDNYIMVTTVLASLKAKGLMKDDFHYYQEGYNIEGTLSGLHTANYFLFGKSDVMYDIKTNDLYFDSKSY